MHMKWPGRYNSAPAIYLTVVAGGTPITNPKIMVTVYGNVRPALLIQGFFRFRARNGFKAMVGDGVAKNG